MYLCTKNISIASRSPLEIFLQMVILLPAVIKENISESYFLQSGARCFIYKK